MKRKAFTLIELLVVIAIIAILAAILYSVYQKVQLKSRLTRVISNMHQIAIAEQAYREDYDGYYVPALLVMTPPNVDSMGITMKDGPDGMMGCAPPRVTGVVSFRLLKPWIDTRKVWDYEPFGGGKCQGWGWGGYKFSPNIIVHGRNLMGRALGPRVEETGNYRMGTGYGTADWDAWSGGGVSTNSGLYYLGYWKQKATLEVDPDGNPIMGTHPGWPPTLQDSQVNFPDKLISWSHCVRAVALEPSSFLWRGMFHESYSVGINGSPLRNMELGDIALALFCDGHVETRGDVADLGEPVMWNNSPYADGGGWNRNRTIRDTDDIYHGLETKTDAKYPNPFRRFTGWIAVADQLCTDFNDPLSAGQGGYGGVGYYFHSGLKETVFDEDLTYGDYNTMDRPDGKFDEVMP